jgi:hypothetical protein
MTVSQSNESFLLGQFRDFYTEVIRLKELIKNQGGMSPETVALAKTASTEDDTARKSRLNWSTPTHRSSDARNLVRQ